MVAIVAAICFAPTLILAVREVAAGRGAGTYTNVYGLPIHWTSVVTMIGLVTLLMVVAGLGRLLYLWRVRRDAKAIDRLLQRGQEK
jgi:hypothetical protein